MPWELDGVVKKCGVGAGGCRVLCGLDRFVKVKGEVQ